MANLGLTEMLVVFILVIVFVGPDDLPKMMRFLGRTYGKIRRASDDLRRAFTLEVDKVDAEARAGEIKRRREALLARRKEEAAKRREAEAEGEELAPETVPMADKPIGEAAQPSIAPETPEHTELAEKALEDRRLADEARSDAVFGADEESA
ncbi:MAG: hypothetical protein GY913_09060 [Proteobacteria bacterium]|nr:hypothetical protein [Pseudomonadota bacterium]MCP4917060.1 hypothetical protein [Pseudomonadota bacterium]